MIPYNEAKRVITAVVFEDDAIVYIKGHKQTRLWNLLLDDEREHMSRFWMRFMATWNLYLI